MAITKDVLVDDLYKILTSSIVNPRFFNARSKGFRAELEYIKKVSDEGADILDAGQFVLSKKDADHSPENFIFYMTISNDEKSRYNGFYDMLLRLPELKKMFFIEIGEESLWDTREITIKDASNKKKIPAEILMPSLTVYRYEGGRWNQSDFNEITNLLVSSSGNSVAINKENHLSYLRDYAIDEIINVYCNRYVLDVALKGHKKGMMDFDLIVIEDGKYIAIETKEKDPIGKTEYPDDPSKWAFGWDSRRIGWYMHLKMELGLDTRYVIREVNNQTERRFEKWKMIDIDRFGRCASWLAERAGGGGGGTISASYSAFVDI